MMMKGRLAAAWALALMVTSPLNEAVHRTWRTPAQKAAPAAGDPDSILWMEMRNVDLHIDEHQVMHMRVLRGQVVATTPGTIAVLDDLKSFHVRVTKALVALSGDAIAALLNTVAFNYADAPIKHLRVR